MFIVFACYCSRPRKHTNVGVAGPFKCYNFDMLVHKRRYRWPRFKPAYRDSTQVIHKRSLRSRNISLHPIPHKTQHCPEPELPGVFLIWIDSNRSFVCYINSEYEKSVNLFGQTYELRNILIHSQPRYCTPLWHIWSRNLACWMIWRIAQVGNWFGRLW